MLFTHVLAFCERCEVGDAVELGEQRVDARQRELRGRRGEPARRFVKAEERSTTQTNALDLLLAGRRRRRGGRRRWRLEPRRDRLVRHVGSHELRRRRRRPPANCRKARRKYARRTYYRTPEAARHPLQFPRPAALRVRLRRTASADESYKKKTRQTHEPLMQSRASAVAVVRAAVRGLFLVCRCCCVRRLLWERKTRGRARKQINEPGTSSRRDLFVSVDHSSLTLIGCGRAAGRGSETLTVVDPRAGARHHRWSGGRAGRHGDHDHRNDPFCSPESATSTPKSASPNR